MMPWVHLQGEPNGDIKPCCMVPFEDKIGSLRDNTLQEIWNSDGLKELRLNMLSDRRSDTCTRCYEQEEAGAMNLRQDSINHFSHHFDVVETTQDDGTVSEMNIKYMDFRFSNVCNFRCRSCGPQLSSRWHADTVKLFGSYSEPVIIKPTDDPDTLWKQLEPIIPDLEEIYFAGGEPLIMEEHYRILKILDDKGLHHVRLKYNTNFSEMKFKNQDVMKIWDNFEDVKVGASLDGMHERGEYIRKGQKWAQTIENRIRMKEVCPNTEFFISCTVSLMNADHISDFHNEWYNEGLIGIDDFHANILLFPNYLRAQVLTPEIKARVTDKINGYINGALVMGKSERTDRAFKSVVNFMNKKDMTSELLELKSYMDNVDRIRGESFSATFPELRGLFDEV